MSSNSDTTAGGGGGHAAITAGPRLQPGCFATWRPKMEVHLARNGADEIHLEVSTAAEWLAMTTQVKAWAKETTRDAVSMAIHGASVKSSGASAAVTDEMKAARRICVSLVERSRRVHGVIFASLPDDLAAQVAHLPSGWAFGLWDWLIKKYQNIEDDGVDAMCLEFSQLRMAEDESYDAYRARVSDLATRLDYAKEKPSPRLFKIAMIGAGKLHPVYRPAVMAMMNAGVFKDVAKIDWDSVTAKLNAVEREEALSQADGSVMAVRSWAKTASGGRGDNRGDGRSDKRHSDDDGDSSSRSGDNASGVRRGPGPRTMADIECFNCHKYGHFSRNCPKKQAASTGSGSASGDNEEKVDKSDKGDKPPRTGRTNAVIVRSNPFEVLSNDEEELEGVNSSGVNSSGVNSTGVNSTGVNPGVNSGGSGVNSGDISLATSAVALTTEVIVKRSKLKGSEGAPASHQRGTKVACVDKMSTGPVSKHSWGIDTMASVHCSGNRHHFAKLVKCRPLILEMANGASLEVTYRGQVRIPVSTSDGSSTLSVDGVYFHDKISHNLLSWGKLRKRGWELHSSASEEFVTTPGGNKISLTTLGRVSVLAVPDTAVVYNVGSVNINDVDALVRLHERLGHMGFDRMVTTIKGGKTLDLDKFNTSKATLDAARPRVMDCDGCSLGRGTRTAFGHRGLDKGDAPCATLHMDTFHIAYQRDGHPVVDYGLVITDPYTKYIWFEKLNTKDQGASRVIDVVRRAQTQSGSAVKRLYADGGSEFINATLKAFCAKNGTELHYPPARTPQLNSVAERTVRTVKDMARTLLLRSGLPEWFWHRAANHAIFVYNRTKVSTVTGVTPFESLYKQMPGARHWGNFGCNAFYHVPKEQRTALQAKTEACVYLGHDEVQNCAAVYILSKKKTVVTRDVEYRDIAFTHAAAIAGGQDAVNNVLASEYTSDITARFDDGLNEAALQGGLVTSSAPTSGVAPEVIVNIGDANSAAPSDSDDDDVYEVERIIGKRVNQHGGIEYRVKWVGYPTGAADRGWEPAESLSNAAVKVAEYEDNQPLASLPAVDIAPEPVALAPDVAPALVPDVASALAPAPASAPAPVARESCRLRDLEPASESALRESRRLRGLGAVGPSIGRVNTQFVMSCIRGMQGADLDMDDPDKESDPETVCAVTAGVELLDDVTPDTHATAMASKDKEKWRVAEDKEMASMKELGVWDYVRRDQLPRGTNILPVKWVYKIKTDENGKVTTYKARLTPKGFKQKYGQDFFDVYAATGMYKTMRVGLSLATKWDHELEQLDIPTAFLNADLEEDVYMELPDGYSEGHEGMVCKLNKALYGLKQAPRRWYLLISKYIKEKLGYKACVSDPCLFYKRSRTGRLMLMFLFVDDFQVSFHHEDRAEWEELKAMLVASFKAKDMGPSTWILGMRIRRDRRARTITLDQELYVTKALEKYGLSECKVAPTPEIVGQDSHPDTTLDTPANRVLYMEMTGTLMYAATATRLDIAHAAHYLASQMQAPTKRHMLAAERILRYLAGTKDVGLVFGSYNGATVGDSRGRQFQQQIDVCCFADADWANSKTDRRSITGWVSKLNGDAVSWASKKQRTVALSTCEAELYAGAAACQEVLWLRGLLAELGLHAQTGSTVYGDNQSAIAVSHNGIKGERTKHVDIKYHFVTETVERGDVKLKWIPTTEQLADIFTKALHGPLFEHFRKQLMSR